jgi:MFS family permease
LAGAGAGINELTALAATSELAPTAKRGKYVAVLVFTIVPFCPSVLWAQLIAYHSSWRYIGLLCGLWAFIGLVMTAVFYFPPPRVNSLGLSRREIIEQIDFVGGFLSITGMILFIGGLVWGGYMVFIPHKTCNKSDLTWITSTTGPLPTFLFHSFSEAFSSSALVSGSPMVPSSQCSRSVSEKTPTFSLSP